MTDLWNKYLRYLFPLRVINGNVGHKVKQNQKHDDKQLNIFKEYDTDNNGYISLLDLRITGAVKGFGEVIDFLMEQYDIDKDNQLSYQEFKALYPEDVEEEKN